MFVLKACDRLSPLHRHTLSYITRSFSTASRLCHSYSEDSKLPPPTIHINFVGKLELRYYDHGCLFFVIFYVVYTLLKEYVHLEGRMGLLLHSN